MDAPKAQDILQKKKVLKKSDVNTNIFPQVLYSPSGEHFIENISAEKKEPQITLWNGSNFTPIISFSECPNRPIFDPLSNYLIFFSKTRFGENYPIASLYSITHNKKIPLYNNQNCHTVFKNIELSLSANGQYIMYNFLRDQQYTNIKKLIKYNRKKGALKDVLIDSWNIGSQWQFCSDFPHPDGAQNILYLDPSCKLITKRNIDNNTRDIQYKLKQECHKIKLNGSLITVQYDNEIELFALESNSMKSIKTIPYKESVIKILRIKEKGITIHQSGKSSFIILNNNYEEIFSYSFKNGTETDPRIEKIITNEAGTHFLVLYKYNVETSPSSIVLFSLSPEGMIRPQLTKHFKDKITSIQFLSDTFLLIQGIKTYIFDLMGNKVETLGASQSCTTYKNSVLQIHQTSAFAFDHRAREYYQIPMKSKLCLSLLDKEMFNK
jgi:hypothetical protein